MNKFLLVTGIMFAIYFIISIIVGTDFDKMTSDDKTNHAVHIFIKVIGFTWMVVLVILISERWQQ